MEMVFGTSDKVFDLTRGQIRKAHDANAKAVERMLHRAIDEGFSLGLLAWDQSQEGDTFSTKLRCSNRVIASVDVRITWDGPKGQVTVREAWLG